MDYKFPILVITTLCGILYLSIEFYCYFLIFYSVFKHDNTEAIKILKPSVIRQRNQANVISLVGQVLGFVIKLWYMVAIGVLAIPFNAIRVREVSGILKTFDFVAIPLVMILSTSTLRNFFK